MIKDVQEFLFCICSVFIHVFKHIKDVFNQMELTYSKIQIEKYYTTKFFSKYNYCSLKRIN